MTLGAQTGSIFRMVTGHALRLTAAGAALRSVLANLLFGMGASSFPARRAMRTDPGAALRQE